MKKLLTVFFFAAILPMAWSQRIDCTQSLSQAQDEFNAGHFFGLSSILQQCLESDGFSNEQKVQAYRLLAQAYLLTDDPIAAEDSYLKLLIADPEYLADEIKDPVDIYFLSKKFTATPRFTPTLFRLGGNLSFVHTTTRINTNSSSSVSYKQGLKVGYQIGSGIDYNVNDHLAVSTEVNLALKGYSRTENGLFGGDEKSVTETQYWLDVPIYVKYAAPLGKIRPFGYAGFALNYLISSKAQMVAINNEGISQNPTEGPNENLLYKRNRLNYSVLLGGGIRYKIGRDFLMVDLRYMAGLSNVVNKDYNYYDAKSGYTMANTIGKYQYIGDYFRLDNLSLSVGYVKPLYAPRKIKKARTKSAMKKISKQDN